MYPTERHGENDHWFAIYGSIHVDQFTVELTSLFSRLYLRNT